MKKTIRRGRRLLVMALLLSVGVGSGCQSMNHTERGALTGGGIGAATGALIGSTKGKAGAGALIGAGVGTIAGGLPLDASAAKQMWRAVYPVVQPPSGFWLARSELFKLPADAETFTLPPAAINIFTAAEGTREWVANDDVHP